jgi:photosystem II stability/assembly factor-like uncharacterized protein
VSRTTAVLKAIKIQSEKKLVKIRNRGVIHRTFQAEKTVYTKG